MSGFVIEPLLFVCVIRLSKCRVIGVVSREISMPFLQSITDYNYRAFADQCRLLSCKTIFIDNI